MDRTCGAAPAQGRKEGTVEEDRALGGWQCGRTAPVARLHPPREREEEDRAQR